MAKLRKMLGQLDSISVQLLMKSIESQSQKTISTWCINYAKNYILPIFVEEIEDDKRCEEALFVGLKYLEGECDKNEVKEHIKIIRGLCKEYETNVVATACCRAISQAIASISKATNSLSIAFYGSAAIAYYELGLYATEEAYNEFANKEIDKMRKALEVISIIDEKNPAKIDWKC